MVIFVMIKQLFCVVVIPRFADIVESTVETLSQNPRAKIDEEGVIQTSQLVSSSSKHYFSLLKSSQFHFLKS